MRVQIIPSVLERHESTGRKIQGGIKLNTLGVKYRITSFGESHGNCVGVIIDGCPAGLKLRLEIIQKELNRRKPGQSSLTTNRHEEDKLEILSGLYNNHTTGAPICMLIWNQDHNSSGYEKRRWTPRPSHADYTAWIRYGGYNDYRGGGLFSGRLTAGYVMAGAVAKKILETLGVEILAHTCQIGNIKADDITVEEIRANVESNLVKCGSPDAATEMEKLVKMVAEKGDSLGGAVECTAINVPAGLGQPIFDTLEGDLAKALFSIPAVKAVEFGQGVMYSKMKGSQANDPFILKDGKIQTATNNAGGILGGLSNGMPIKCRVTFKPTPSINMEQSTVDIREMEQKSIRIEGRHDPCIVPRAVPVVEAMIAIVLTDHILRAGLISQVIGGKLNK